MGFDLRDLPIKEHESGWHWRTDYDLLLCVKNEQPGCTCK